MADNGLELAVAIVDSADELCLSFSIEEMKDLATNLGFPDAKFTNDEDAADDLINFLAMSQDEFPEFTAKLGKKLLEGSKKSTKAKAPTANKPAKKASGDAPKARVKLDYDAQLVTINTKCKKGSILDTIVKAIDEELCDSVQEVLDYITSNHVIPKTGELADVKFAEHNVKYFIKNGNISQEEEL